MDGYNGESLKLVSLFTGAGGLDYGFEAAGFDVAVAVENDEDCCATVAANRDWPLIKRDLGQVPNDYILAVGGLKRGDAHLLIGGPPCQPFSKSGYWFNGDSGRLDDPRAGTLFEFMRCVEGLLPRVFLLENVHGIAYSGKEEGFLLLDRMTGEINRKHGTNYQLSWKVLNTADFGVPQIRRRFFLIGERSGAIFDFPRPTHFETPSNQHDTRLFQFGRRIEYVTAWDAIGDLDEPALCEDEDLRAKGRWADLLPSIPEGENYLWHTNRKDGLPLFGWRTRFWTFLLKLAKNRPSWTIQAQPGPAVGPFHWKNRRLSVKETARLQTFPEDVEFVGNRASIQRQLGNAAPSLMAEVLAREIAFQFFGRSMTGPPTLSVPRNRPIPYPESVRPVPRKFHGLIGNHADHPGEGKGRRARKQPTQATLPFA